MSVNARIDYEAGNTEPNIPDRYSQSPCERGQELLIWGRVGDPLWSVYVYIFLYIEGNPAKTA